ncbi:MAG: Holliday junction branch migration protein RuvA [Helicobacteraceae bacterium]|nr:Holliday junction branch migration protein RuvA [Helicobacteraceae bacterium]
MVSAVEGTLLRKEPSFCDLMTAGGSAYRIFYSLNTFSRLNDEKARLLTTMIVRQDAITLFGFLEERERLLFEQLIKISGVGPKSAIAILSTFTPEHFVEAIAERNEALLTKVPGIGKKTAALIIVQFAGTIENLTPSGAPEREASQALESLGFKPAEIAKAIGRCASTDTVSIIKEALKILQRIK